MGFIFNTITQLYIEHLYPTSIISYTINYYEYSDNLRQIKIRLNILISLISLSTSSFIITVNSICLYSSNQPCFSTLSKVTALNLTYPYILYYCVYWQF